MGDAYIRDTYGIAKEACGRGEEKPRPEPPEDKDPWEIIPPPYRWFEDPEEIFPRDPVTGEKYNLTKLIKKQRIVTPYNWFNIRRGLVKQVNYNDYDDFPAE